MNTPETRTPHDEAERTARDRFVHGLLQVAHERPLDRERRVERAMVAVRRDARDGTLRARLMRRAGGLATIAAVMAAALIFTPSQVSAADRARATAQGERAPRDRRVMFLLNPPDFASDRPTLTGTLDVRDERHMVLTLRLPEGGEETHGIDGDRAWSIDRAGRVHDEPADHPWPVWIRSPRGGLLVDMAEAIESGLVPGWSWSVSRAEMGETGIDRLVATREQGPRAEPNRITASIDARSGRVKRLEIEWPNGGAPAPFAGRDGDRPPPPPGGVGARPRPIDGPPHPPTGGARDPMGAPGSMVIVPEPPITFADDWFSAARHEANR